MSGRRRIEPATVVTVIRSGYATEALWVAAIRQALAHGREVHAIDAAGRSAYYRPGAGGPIIEDTDW
jgi:hypothetical protein